jgi:hypothetical protein
VTLKITYKKGWLSTNCPYGEKYTYDDIKFCIIKVGSIQCSKCEHNCSMDFPVSLKDDEIECRKEKMEFKYAL